MHDLQTCSPASARRPPRATLRTAATVYARALEMAPVITKSLTAGVIFGASDLAAQVIENATAPPDWPRLLTAALVGLLYFGPAAHFWYAMMQRLYPRSTLRAVLTKTALGQIVFAPIFTIVYFAAALVAANGLIGLGQLRAKVAADLLPTIVAGLWFWPLVDVVSFAVIAKQEGGEAWLPLFVNAVSLVWQVYLSLKARGAGEFRPAQLRGGCRRTSDGRELCIDLWPRHGSIRAL